MGKALFINGVYDSVLDEIYKSQKDNPGKVFYLQPYSESVIKQLEIETPEIHSPLPLYASTTNQLNHICYIAYVVGWENKNKITQKRLSDLNEHMKKFQPEEGQVYFEVNGKKCVNLISIVNLKKLTNPFSIAKLIKESDRQPLKPRSRAGGWIYVYPLPLLSIENTIVREQFEEQFEGSVSRSLADNHELRKNRLKVSAKVPEIIQTISYDFKRNPDVIAEVLGRSCGKCELCRSSAPFLKASDGSPYLEVHHWVTLSEGGEDTVDNAVALCPNCHKQAHFGQLRDFIKSSKALPVDAETPLRKRSVMVDKTIKKMSGKLKTDKVKNTASKFHIKTRDTVSKVSDFTKTSSQNVHSFVLGSLPASLPFFSLPELLKWSENVTKSAATIYDKALDADYLATHIGGGNHRMFDAGHDLVGAWNAVKSASGQDMLQQEVLGFTSAIWKDMTTVKGMPFFTWSKDAYEKSADWVSNSIPGASKDWFYDLMSYDAFEILSASIGAVAIFYFLSKHDIERLSEILGSMGIISIISANPLMGIAVVLCTGYSFFIKKNELDKKRIVIGASVAAISASIFSILGLPVLVELGIVIVSTKLIKDQVFENEELLNFIKLKMMTTPRPALLKESLSSNYEKIYATLSQLVRRGTGEPERS